MVVSCQFVFPWRPSRTVIYFHPGNINDGLHQSKGKRLVKVDDVIRVSVQELIRQAQDRDEDRSMQDITNNLCEHLYEHNNPT